MFNLPRNLRALFGFLRALSLLWLFAFPLITVVNPWIQAQFSATPAHTIGLGDLKFTTKEAPLLVSAEDGQPRMEVRFLRASGVVNLATLSPSLRGWITASLLVAHGLGAGWYAWLFGRLRNMCHNLERGLVFAPENTKSLSQIGWGLIVYTCAGLLLGVVMNDTIMDPLYAGASVQGRLGEFLTLDPNGIRLDFGFPTGGPVGNLVLGCLVLLLARAFDQGLKLKTENDLTV